MFFTIYSLIKNIKEFHFHIFLNLLVILIASIFEAISIATLFPLLENFSFSNNSNFLSRVVNEIFLFINIPLIFINLFIFFIVINLLKYIFVMFQQFYNRYISSRLVNKFRVYLLSNLVDENLENFKSKKIGDLTSTLTISAQNAGGMIEYVLLSLKSIIFLFAYLFLSLYLSTFFTLIILSTVVIFYFFLIPLFKSANALGTKEKNLLDQMHSFLNDQFLGFRVLKAFNIEDKSKNNFKIISNEYAKNDVRLVVNKIFSYGIFEPLIFLTVSLSLIITYINFDFNISNILIVLLIFSQIIPNLKNLNSNLITIKQLLPHYKSIEKFYKKESHKIQDGLNKSKFNFTNNLNIKNLSFKYNKSDIIFKDLEISIQQNNFIGVVGVSGSGKSTFLDIILGILHPTSGIFVDSLNESHKTLRGLSNEIAFVDQNIFLFNDTIMNNICLNKHYSKESIFDVLKLLNLEDSIKSLPKGLNSIIGDSGINLSIGQKQRLTLARAILTKPKILVLDEFTSALDKQNKTSIVNLIYKLSKNITVICATHDLDILENCDKVILFEKNKQVKIDTFTNLKKHSDLFKNLL